MVCTKSPRKAIPGCVGEGGRVSMDFNTGALICVLPGGVCPLAMPGALVAFVE
jgi:hypothetical protein